MKFNEYASVVVSAGYDQSLRTWDCRSHSTEPIQVAGISLLLLLFFPFHVYVYVLIILNAFVWDADY